MSRAGDASRLRSFAEHVAERFLRQRLPSLAHDEGQVAARAGRECLGQDGQNRQRHRDREIALFRLDRRHAIADMLATEAYSVAAAQARVKQNVEPYSLPRSDRPARS